MLWHNNVPKEFETVFVSGAYNGLDKDGFYLIRAEEGQAVTTAGGYKVYVVREIESNKFTHYDWSQG